MQKAEQEKIVEEKTSPDTSKPEASEKVTESTVEPQPPARKDEMQVESISDTKTPEEERKRRRSQIEADYPSKVSTRKRTKTHLKLSHQTRD